MRVRTQLAALVEVATEPIAANQCHFGIGEMDHATLEYCKAHGIAVESYGAIARTGHSLAVNGIHMDPEPVTYGPGASYSPAHAAYTPLTYGPSH
jgi:diketogulonate reductase-like aldo/keto reductase